MFTIWTIPRRWDPRVFMHSSTMGLCTKALIKKMKQLDLPIHCKVSKHIKYLLREVTPTSPNGMIYQIEEYEWLNDLHRIIQRYEDKIIDDDLSVVVPIGITFDDLDGSQSGHSIIGILSRKDENSIHFQICDGNGYYRSWHRPFMNEIVEYYSDYGRNIIPSFDKSQPNVNYIETTTVRKYLARLDIRYPDLGGQCAFLAYIYTMDHLCTGILEKGHGKRLFQDLLLTKENDKMETLKPWELAIVSAYVMATAYRVLQIMVEAYPTKTVALRHGWDERLDYPNLSDVRTIQVSKHVENGVLKLRKYN